MKKQAIILVTATALALFGNPARASIVTDTLNEVGPGSTVSIQGVGTSSFSLYPTSGSPTGSYYYATAGEFGAQGPPTLTYFDNSPVPFTTTGSVVLAGTGGAVVTFGDETVASAGSTGEPSGSYWDYAEFFAAGAQSTSGLTSVGLDYTPSSGEPGYVSGNTITYVFQPVPETSTLIAGALMLLPVAASTLRMLRRQQVA